MQDMLLPNWGVPACLLLNPGPECIASNSGNANKQKVMVQLLRYFHQWKIYCLADCSSVPGHKPGSLACLSTDSSMSMREPQMWHRTVFPLWISNIRFLKPSIIWSYQVTFQQKTAVSVPNDTLQSASSWLPVLPKCRCRFSYTCKELGNLPCTRGIACRCNCRLRGICKFHTPWKDKILLKYFQKIFTNKYQIQKWIFFLHWLALLSSWKQCWLMVPVVFLALLNSNVAVAATDDNIRI